MNAYFFNMTNEERDNILNQHKEIYDGYVTQYAKPNEQPLYVQDFANDKNGITVSNKGNVGEYRHMNINEMKYDGKDTGLFSDEATEDVFSGSHGFEPEETFESEEPMDEMELDTIGDGPVDLENGTVDLDMVDEDLVEPLQEQLKKTLNMFDRFKKY
jgi:hypothetical protein